jgi:hypothetical protein
MRAATAGGSREHFMEGFRRQAEWRCGRVARSHAGVHGEHGTEASKQVAEDEVIFRPITLVMDRDFIPGPASAFRLGCRKATGSRLLLGCPLTTDNGFCCSVGGSKLGTGGRGGASAHSLCSRSTTGRGFVGSSP